MLKNETIIPFNTLRFVQESADQIALANTKDPKIVYLSIDKRKELRVSLEIDKRSKNSSITITVTDDKDQQGTSVLSIIGLKQFTDFDVVCQAMKEFITEDPTIVTNGDDSSTRTIIIDSNLPGSISTAESMSQKLVFPNKRNTRSRSR